MMSSTPNHLQEDQQQAYGASCTPREAPITSSRTSVARIQVKYLFQLRGEIEDKQQEALCDCKLNQHILTQLSLVLESPVVVSTVSLLDLSQCKYTLASLKQHFHLSMRVKFCGLTCFLDQCSRGRDRVHCQSTSPHCLAQLCHNKHQGRRLKPGISGRTSAQQTACG